MKSTQWLGVCAIAISSATVLSGCSSDPDSSLMNTAGSATTGGTATTGGSAPMAGSGTTGGSGGAPAPAGTQLQSPAYFVKLSGADATTGAAPPPAYTAAGCSSCHGPNGEGFAGVGPEIRFTPKDYAVAVVRNGRKTPSGSPSAMVAVAADKLSDADLDTINTWQNSFAKPASGQSLYLNMCGNCHGPASPTGGSAPISIQGKSKAEVEQYVRNGSGTDVAARASYMPKFDTTLLTDPELQMIEMYLGSM